MTNPILARDAWNVHVYVSRVDNHGDIGVCWRLARQLAGEHGHRVTLWVDDWAGARELIPELTPASGRTDVSGVAVRPWTEATVDADCTGDVLIEGFGCTLPDPALAQLRDREVKPVWVDLEYLSAEAWVSGFHLRSGWDPVGRAQRWMFIPGIGEGSGGLLRECGLLDRRDAWDAARADAHLRVLGLRRRTGGLHVVCFAYAHAPYAEWLDALAPAARGSLELWLCGAQSQSAIERLRDRLPANVAAASAPFVSQDDFDRLLWSADVLWVRGEDSLVRAVWSGKPFVWHIYRQADSAHHAKLGAWLERYTAGFPDAVRQAYIAVHRSWNGIAPASGLAGAWSALVARWDDWLAASRRRSDALAGTPDLTAGLVDFVARRRHA